MANYLLISTENYIQPQKKSDTLEKKLALHSFNRKEWVPASRIWLLTPVTPRQILGGYKKLNWKELRVESALNYALQTYLFHVIFEILTLHCIFIFMKASQSVTTPNNAECTRETVSQMGYNVLLRQKFLIAIMPYYFGQFLKWQRSPCQELGCIHISMTIQESHLLNCWKRTGFYYTMYLSNQCYHRPQHFTKISLIF